MQQFGGKDLNRHFTVVMGDKEHGLYVSSTPSSAAKKAVTKLCAANKSKKVEFSMREITQGSKKKTYGPYLGYIEKLKDPIELKGRVIKYKPFAKLQKKEGGGIFNDIRKQFKNSDMRKRFKHSEFNRNANGKLTNNSQKKMLENFQQKENDIYHLKERDYASDTFYFGYNNLIDFIGKKYFPFSICNIVHNINSLISTVVNPQTGLNQKIANNKTFKLRILINKPYNDQFLQELNKITSYSQSNDVLKGIITEQYSFNNLPDQSFSFLEFNLLFYFQLIKWIIQFGYKLNEHPKNIFHQFVNLIINIKNNLFRLKDYYDPHNPYNASKITFYNLFSKYYYIIAIELCLRQIYNESENFEKEMKKLSQYIHTKKNYNKKIAENAKKIMDREYIDAKYECQKIGKQIKTIEDPIYLENKQKYIQGQYVCIG